MDCLIFTLFVGVRSILFFDTLTGFFSLCYLAIDQLRSSSGWIDLVVLTLVAKSTGFFLLLFCLFVLFLDYMEEEKWTSEWQWISEKCRQSASRSNRTRGVAIYAATVSNRKKNTVCRRPHPTLVITALLSRMFPPTRSDWDHATSLSWITVGLLIERQQHRQPSTSPVWRRQQPPPPLQPTRRHHQRWTRWFGHQHWQLSSTSSRGSKPFWKRTATGARPTMAVQSRSISPLKKKTPKLSATVVRNVSNRMMTKRIIIINQVVAIMTKRTTALSPKRNAW